jgi:hypothetical protein
LGSSKTTVLVRLFASLVYTETARRSSEKNENFFNHGLPATAGRLRIARIIQKMTHLRSPRPPGFGAFAETLLRLQIFREL